MKKKISILLLSILASTLLFGCGKPTIDDVKQKIDKRNYEQVIESYNDLTDEDKQQTVELLKKEIKSIKEKFIKEEINKENAITTLNNLKSIESLSKEIDDNIEFINKVDESRKNFDLAKKFEQDKELPNALAKYSEVIKEDPNYNVAQTKISELEKAIADLIEVDVKNAKIHINSDQYKALYPDQMCVTMVNKTKNKTIKNLIVGFLAFDKNGYPLKIKQQFSYGNDDFEFLGKADNINVMPGKTFGDGYGWNLSENHNISKLLACVKEVEYYDGTTWENPLYNSWITKYKEKPLK
ncbi:DUF5780 domain-containing protein [Clostridium baratii]|uniref:DUF5780 domain-containing protein n=1 Tax=Clostridium baratii TaxID=1561 RepID=UPI0030CF9845